MWPERVFKLIYIAVIGASVCNKEEDLAAFEVGRLIAGRQAVLVCGGGTGVMEAASKGAREAGGTALGILPGKSRREGNKYLSFAVATGLSDARNAIITRTADAVIAIGGQYGTLSEIALALKMKKPVIGLKTWFLKAPQTVTETVIAAQTPLEAVEKAFRSINKNKDHF